MKKLVLAITCVLVSGLANATHGVFVNGKEISMYDTYPSLVKKLGKDSYMNWEVANLSINASAGEYGLESLTVHSNKPNKHRIEVYKAKFSFNETLQAVANKLKPGCFDLVTGKGGATYSFTSRTGAEGEIYVTVSSTINGAPNVKQLLNAKIDSISFGYDDPEPTGKCIE